MASKNLETDNNKKTRLTSPDRLSRGKKNILTPEVLFFLEDISSDICVNAKPITINKPGNATNTTCMPKEKTFITSVKPLTSKINLKYSKSSLPFATNKTTKAKTARSPTPKISEVKWKPNQLQDTSRELKRRNRERNKVKSFELEVRRLRRLQSDFMNTCEELKDMNASLVRGQYKFIGVSLNDKFQLLVNEDDLMRFPKNMPSETINDLKKSVKFCVQFCHMELIDNLRVLANTKEVSDLLEIVDWLDEKLNTLFKTKLDDCLKEIDCLCKDPKNRMDNELTRTMRELQDFRRCYQKLERELDNIKKRNAEEKRSLCCHHKTEFKNVNKAHEDHEKKLKKQIWELKHQLDAQAATLVEKDSIVESKEKDLKALHKDIIKLENSNQELTDDLQKVMNQLTSYKHNEEQYFETINSLQQHLEQEREEFNTFQNIAFKNGNQDIDISEFHKVIIYLKKENKTLADNHRRQNDALEERNQEVIALQNEITHLKELNKTLADRDKDSNQEIIELKNIITQLKEQNETLAQFAKAQDIFYDDKDEEINDLQNIYIQLKEHNESLTCFDELENVSCEDNYDKRNESHNEFTELKEQNDSLMETETLQIEPKNTCDNIEPSKDQFKNAEVSEAKSEKKSEIIDLLNNWEIEDLKNKVLESEKEIENFKNELIATQKLLDERSEKLNNYIISQKEDQEKMDNLTYKDKMQTEIITQLNSEMVVHKEQINLFDFELRQKQMELLWQTEATKKTEARVERRNQEIKMLKEAKKSAKKDDDFKVVYKKKHYKPETGRS